MSVFGGNKIVEDYDIIAHNEILRENTRENTREIVKDPIECYIVIHNGTCVSDAFVKESDAIKYITQIVNQIICSLSTYKKMQSGRTTLLYNEGVLIHKITYNKVKIINDLKP